MKKLITSVFAAMLCTSMLAGCVSTAPAENQPSKPENPATSAATASPEAAPAASSEAAADSALPKKLVLGLDASFPPMGFTDESNNIVGVDIDLAKAVCEKLGIEFEAKPIDWASKEMELNTGKITCIWNGLTVTAERKDAFELSRSYMKNEQVVVVLKDSPIKTKADLAGKIVAAQSDSSGLEALQKDEICISIKDGAPKEYADYVTAMGDLEIGRCDAIVMDSVVANYYITANNKPMVILEEKMSAEEYAIAFKKGDTALKDAVEGALSELAKEGKVAEISKNWFGKEDMIITY